jgi:hypothetical protein
MWFVFDPKIPIWVNFGGPWNGKCCYILLSFGIFYDHLEYFMDIWQNVCMAVWYSLWSFGIGIFPHIAMFAPRKI